jgi:hypothetical protein
VDRSREAGIDFVHFNGMSGELYLLEIMGSGAALLDYDGDGDLDAYLVQSHMAGPHKSVAEALIEPRHPLPLSDRLYRNDSRILPDGSREVRFTDVTEESGIADVATGYGMGVTTGDYDNDGWVDLYLSNFGPNQLLRNGGDGTFTDVTGSAGPQDRRWSIAASFFDYDRDGLLDLYVLNYVDFTFANHHMCTTQTRAGVGIATGRPDYCGPLAYAPTSDRLFHNRGDGTFEDVTSAAGMQGATGSGLGVASADFDGDGLPDVSVGNDGMANFLWMNRGDGTFVDEALLAGCSVNRMGNPEASMGMVAEDADGDGDVDLFMTHLTRETNTLFLNDGSGLFLDQTAESGLGPASFEGTGFGAGFLDYDNDGDLDVMIANGAVALLDELVLQEDVYPLHQPNQLFENLSDSDGERRSPRYAEVTAEAGPVFGLSEVSRGIAFGDVDNDGDPDALLSNNSGPARLLINVVGQDEPFLGLRLLERGRDAFGARAGARIGPAGGSGARGGEISLWRHVHTDGSYASASDPRIHLGVGSPDGVEEVRIHWPDGTEQLLRGVETGRYLILARPGNDPDRRDR